MLTDLMDDIGKANVMSATLECLLVCLYEQTMLHAESSVYPHPLFVSFFTAFK